MARRPKRNTTPRTHGLVIMDKSGSMQVRAEATRTGYNEFLQQLKDNAEGEYFLTLIQFDTLVTTVVDNKPLAQAEELDYYAPNGMTALYDAVGEGIRRIQNRVRKGDNVVVTIMTDGAENSSREFNKASINALMDQKRAEGWEFNFLGAGQAAWQGAQDLGISYDYTINYAGTAAQQETAFAAAALSNVSKTRGLTSSYSASAGSLKGSLEGTSADKLWTPGQSYLPDGDDGDPS